MKVFLHASLEVRAERTYEERMRVHGRANLARIRDEIGARDASDRARTCEPLVYLPGMLTWDSTHTSLEETLAGLERWIEHHRGRSPLTLSVVIPCQNGGERLGRTLASLEKQSLPRAYYELIVVDDGSTDGSAEVARRHADTVLSTKAVGPGGARNAGVARSSGDVIVLLDADMICPASFLETHLTLHARHNRLCVLGARRHLHPGSHKVAKLDSREVLLRRYGYNLGVLTYPWSLAYTCNMSLPAALAKGTPFDPAFRAWGLEDLDVAVQLDPGVRWHYSRAAAAHHQPHDRRMTEQKYRGWRANLGRFVAKHPHASRYALLDWAFDPRRPQTFMELYAVFDPPQEVAGEPIIGGAREVLDRLQRAAASGKARAACAITPDPDELNPAVLAAAVPSLDVQVFASEDESFVRELESAGVST